MIIRGEREDIGTPALKSIDVKRNVSNDDDEHKTLYSHHSTMIRRLPNRSCSLQENESSDNGHKMKKTNRVNRETEERGNEERDEKLKSVLVSPPHKRYKKFSEIFIN